MANWIYQHHILLFAIGAVALIAFWKGGWPERIAAGANLVGSAGMFVVDRIMPAADHVIVPILVADGLLATIFMLLAIRFASLWLGAAMLLEAAQFALHGYFFVTERPFDLLFAVVNNVISWGVVWVILIGVAASWRRNLRARRTAV